MAQKLRDIHPYATAKLISRDTGVSQRTIEQILGGVSGVSLETFARIAAVYPSIFLALAPVIPWASIAVTAVETQKTVDSQRARLAADMEALKARMEALR